MGHSDTQPIVQKRLLLGTIDHWGPIREIQVTVLSLEEVERWERTISV